MNCFLINCPFRKVQIYLLLFLNTTEKFKYIYFNPLKPQNMYLCCLLFDALPKLIHPVYLEAVLPLTIGDAFATM